MFNDDTISAISTPLGRGGIGIVRLSGKDAVKIVDKIFRSPKKKTLSQTPSHRIVYGYIVDTNKDNPPSPPENPPTSPFDKGGCRGIEKKGAGGDYNKREVEGFSGDIIDEVLVSVMRAPHTYTKEDIVEINCHGGHLPLRKTLELVLKNGARLADPGEFTRRAFLNGRIDLMQAEAVLDTINAMTEQSQKSAIEQLSGRLSKNIEALRDKIAELTAFLEAYIDFPEEDLSLLSSKDITRRAEEIKGALKKLIESSRHGMILREGLKTAIIGRPNVGKSSLLNALLQQDRAIVTEMPGTTRDVIEEYLNIKGFPIRIMDTAGIREYKDIAEKEGVERSLRTMQGADLVLLVLDGSEQLHGTDKELIEKSSLKNTILVINKIDLPQRIKLSQITQIFQNVIARSPDTFGTTKQSQHPEIASPELAPNDTTRFLANARNDMSEGARNDMSEGARNDMSEGARNDMSEGARNDRMAANKIVRVSALNGTGLDELKDKIVETALKGKTVCGIGDSYRTGIVTNIRHVRSLEKALALINSFTEGLNRNLSPEFLSVELRDALDAIGEIIGITTSEDILNRIFSNFCIGK